MPPRRLALFDLDHTLIPFDSGMAWLRFLAARGGVAPVLPTYYEECCRQYVRGSLSLSALHRIAMGPLARHPYAQLLAWQDEFAVEIAPTIPPAAFALVAAHRAAGALCCVVTTTNEFVATPFARVLAVDQLLGTVPRRVGDRFDGQIVGEFCHAEDKVFRIEAWLHDRGEDWESYEDSVAYSDSISDLPLLSGVAKAVAVRPDRALRAEARARGWTIAEELADAL